MIDSVKKLTATIISPFQAYMYFNMYMTRSVFFGCEVIEFSKAQTEELKRIYKSKLSKKL